MDHSISLLTTANAARNVVFRKILVLLRKIVINILNDVIISNDISSLLLLPWNYIGAWSF